MYFSDKKCQIFNNTVYDKIICGGEINAKLISKLGVTAKFEE